MSAAIEVVDLRKEFRVRDPGRGFPGTLRALLRPRIREVTAVDRLSLTIAPGERVAFVGPNGAGKSTTIKILTGILHPSSGSARVLAFVPWKQRTRLARRIGTVFGQRTQLFYHLPAADTLDLLARIYDLDAGTSRRRREDLVERFEVGHLLDKPVRQLSLGERMRFEIVASLLHGPEVLFLDEPTIGLDVTAKAVIRDLVREISERDGCTVFLTSHDTGDMERVCDRVIVLHRGRLLVDERIDVLRKTVIRRKVVTLLTADAEVRIDHPGVEVLQSAPHRIVLEVDVDRTPVGEVVRSALDASRLRDLTVEDPPMDEIVKLLYSRAEGRG